MACNFIPHFFTFDAFVVNPAGHTADRNVDIGDVGVKVVFRVPSPWIVGGNEQKQNTLERPALGVHLQVEAGV